MKVNIPRRVYIFGLMVMLSVLFWVGSSAWLQTLTSQLTAEGANPIEMRLNTLTFLGQATEIWLLMVGLAHVTAGIVSIVRRDREATLGVIMSLVTQLFFVGILWATTG